MAQRKAAPRSKPRTVVQDTKPESRVGRLLRSVVKLLLHFMAPHSAAETVTLACTVLAMVGLVAIGVSGPLVGRQPDGWIAWPVASLAVAMAARLSTRWAPVVEANRWERLREDSGAALLIATDAYMTWWTALGPSGPPPPAGDTLQGALGAGGGAVIAIVLLLRLPVFPVLCLVCVAALTSLGNRIRFWRERFESFRRPEVLEAQEVSLLAPPEPRRKRTPQPRPSAEQQLELLPAEEPSPDGSLSSDAPRNSLLPPIDLFVPPSKPEAKPSDIEHKAQQIRDTLASFNVGARVVGHHCGPVVTQFDIEPDRGVKVRKITELQNDLALALAAPSIRIQAPVPGKPVVGIEIPNSSATTVTLRELLESEVYRRMEAPLRVVLGKDVAGKTAVIDLAKLPHLLIAGATGSGKSVCVNAIISCLLYQNTPDQVRLVMVDPKMVELTVYNGVPHLLAPVVTETEKVVGVLQWAIREMTRRYGLFQANGVRNLGRYNEKAREAGTHRLPSIVLIIDELADLMMVAPEDVEDAIVRLTQLARAAGIHLIIATQRPSVDVVTGLIKANVPARIAFAMTSQVDSRTILDTAGAEKLLGRGDMLYQPPDAPKPVRLQGAFLSDQETERLVEFWKESPLHSHVQHVSEEEFAGAARESADAGDDLLGDAVSVVREYKHASVSLLQRRLRVGYARAARLMDQLEDRGIVGAADGSKQRPVLDFGEDG
jgi:DNA segregation ATPase FtsK/SpoIIIE, S-DNA-T family